MATAYAEGDISLEDMVEEITASGLDAGELIKTYLPVSYETLGVLQGMFYAAAVRHAYMAYKQLAAKRERRAKVAAHRARMIAEANARSAEEAKPTLKREEEGLDKKALERFRKQKSVRFGSVTTSEDGGFSDDEGDE